MSNEGIAALERRLQALEDRIAIYQIVCGYGYAMDGCNEEAVAEMYAEDGVYAVADLFRLEGRRAAAAITRDEMHLDYIRGGVAHMSTLPYVVLDGDRATATCHTMQVRHGESGFYVHRCSASRIELSRGADGRWRIDHRQNYMQDGSPKGPALLARLNEGPA